ncbi:TfuA-like protein [Streptomyces sp. WMMC905]|uniref:TfuA-like protein n=1 Tax=Streptomyces sp. WMMC905 TaxID=3404123 RepID=UPI003B955AD9
MTSRTRFVVTAGPSISAAAIRRAAPEADVRAPVAADEVLRWDWAEGDVLVVIDGVFRRARAIRHEELLSLLDRGVTVYGASGMGALRAAELSAFGMRGVGEVFRAFRDGVLVGDDEVALVDAGAEDGYRPTSWALVDLREAADRAADAGVIDRATARTLVEAAKSLPFSARDCLTVLDRARRRGCRPAALESFRAHRAALGPGVGYRDAAEAVTRAAVERRSPVAGRPRAATGLRYRGVPTRLAPTTFLRLRTPTPVPAEASRRSAAVGAPPGPSAPPARRRHRDDEILARLALEWSGYPEFQRSVAAECLLSESRTPQGAVTSAGARNALAGVCGPDATVDPNRTHLEWGPLARALFPRLARLGLPSCREEAGDALSLLRDDERGRAWQETGPLLAARLWLGDPRVDWRTPLIERLRDHPALSRAWTAADEAAARPDPVVDPRTLRELCRALLARWGATRLSDVPAALRDHGFTDMRALVDAVRVAPSGVVWGSGPAVG